MIRSDLYTDVELEHNGRLYVAEVRVLYGEEKITTNHENGSTTMYSPSPEDIEFMSDIDIYDLNVYQDGAKTETYRYTTTAEELSQETIKAFRDKVMNSSWTVVESTNDT